MAVLAFLGIFGAIGWLLVAKKPIVHLEVFKDRNFTGGMRDDLRDGRRPLRERRDHPAVRPAESRLHRDMVGPDPVAGRRCRGHADPDRRTADDASCRRGSDRLSASSSWAARCYYSSGLSPEHRFRDAGQDAGRCRSAGLAFLFVPISTVTYLTLPRRLNGDGAALFSMFRNVFGSIGISAVDGAGHADSQMRQAYLSQWASPSTSPTTTRREHMSGRCVPWAASPAPPSAAARRTRSIRCFARRCRFWPIPTSSYFCSARRLLRRAVLLPAFGQEGGSGAGAAH